MKPKISVRQFVTDNVHAYDDMADDVLMLVFVAVNLSGGNINHQTTTEDFEAACYRALWQLGKTGIVVNESSPKGKG
jgi:hypothetical protein